VVVVLVAAAVVLVVSRSGSNTAGSVAAGGTTTSPRSQPTSHSRASHSSSPRSTASGRPALPAGWTRHTDSTYGWSAYIPPGWTQSQQSGGVQFNDPAGGRYVLFGTRYPAGSSAIGAWESEEQYFQRAHSNYQRLEMRTVSFAGAKDAADWEFTYTDGNVALRALDRGMVFGHRGYGIYFQTHSDSWAGSSHVLSTILASFKPGRTGA
jgi:hypothetical protein